MLLISGSTGDQGDGFSVSSGLETPSAWRSLWGLPQSPTRMSNPRLMRSHPASRQSSCPAQNAQDGEGSALWVLRYRQQRCDTLMGARAMGKAGHRVIFCPILGQASIAGVPERCPGQPSTKVPRGFYRHFLLRLPFRVTKAGQILLGRMLGFGAFSLKWEECECCFFTTQHRNSGCHEYKKKKKKKLQVNTRSVRRSAPCPACPTEGSFNFQSEMK